MDNKLTTFEVQMINKSIFLVFNMDNTLSSQLNQLSMILRKLDSSKKMRNTRNLILYFSTNFNMCLDDSSFNLLSKDGVIKLEDNVRSCGTIDSLIEHMDTTNNFISVVNRKEDRYRELKNILGDIFIIYSDKIDITVIGGNNRKCKDLDTDGRNYNLVDYDLGSIKSSKIHEIVDEINDIGENIRTISVKNENNNVLYLGLYE